MTEDDKETIKEELHALCLQFGLHPHTFDNEPFIENEIKRRKEDAKESV